MSVCFFFTYVSKDSVSGKNRFGMYVHNFQIQQNIYISDNASVFSFFLLVILWAIWWIELVKPPNSTICLDSAAALLAFRGGT